MILSFVLKKPLISTLIIVGVLTLVFFIMSFFIKKIDPMKKTPLWLIPFIMIVEIVNNFVKDTIGKRWKSYSPWFLTLVIFIFFANIRYNPLHSAVQNAKFCKII